MANKAEKPGHIIEGKTKSGISFVLDTRIKDDARFMHYLVKLQDKSVDKTIQLKYLYSMLEMMFGEEGLFIFEQEIAKRHDGICSVKEFTIELQDIYEALGLKNSSPSPAA